MNPRGGRHPRRAAAPKSWRSRHGKWLLALGGTLVVVAGAIVAFNVRSEHQPAHSSTPASPVQPTSRSSVSSSATSSPSNPPSITGLAADFAQLASQLHAQTGVVLAPVGTGFQAPVTLGDWNSGPAWSTIKVPLVIAGMRQQNTGQVTDAMTQAITESDNAAAESIWEGLGDPVTAAAKVEAVLRDAGDQTTVQSQKVRPDHPEFTAFGQTEWSLANQVRFLAYAACDPRDQPALALMGQVENDQKWGLGTLSDTKIKGGWGPAVSGRYLVRQIGILPTSKGLTVVAFAAEPDSGSFSDGTQDLTQIAQWLQGHSDALPAAQCTA